MRARGEEFDVGEQLLEVERLIEEFRWARSQEGTSEERTYRVLKAIARDLRGRLNGATSVASRALGSRLEAVRLARDPESRARALRGVGEELVGRWPAVRIALEREKLG